MGHPIGTFYDIDCGSYIITCRDSFKRRNTKYFEIMNRCSWALCCAKYDHDGFMKVWPQLDNAIIDPDYGYLNLICKHVTVRVADYYDVSDASTLFHVCHSLNKCSLLITTIAEMGILVVDINTETLLEMNAFSPGQCDVKGPRVGSMNFFVYTDKYKDMRNIPQDDFHGFFPRGDVFYMGYTQRGIMNGDIAKSIMFSTLSMSFFYMFFTGKAQITIKKNKQFITKGEHYPKLLDA